MLELYYYENSVCSERVLMIMAEKGIDDWTGHHIDLFKGESTDPEYLKLNPKGQVPTLVHDGQIIRESSIICDYLDNLYPQRPLKPTGSARCARMREWIKESDEAGFQGVAALSFAAVFRDKLLKKTQDERDKMWAEQTDLSRTFRQKSCFEKGLESPYAVIAIAAWDRIFKELEQALSDNRSWIMGDQFTLVELNFASLIARLEAMGFLGLWLDRRTHVTDWWQRLKTRTSFVKARIGPCTGAEKDNYAREGRKHFHQAQRILREIN